MLKTTKVHHISILFGDFNANLVEGGSIEGYLGNYGLGDHTERGDRLIQFCESSVNNTQFVHTNTKKKLHYTKSSKDEKY